MQSPYSRFGILWVICCSHQTNVYISSSFKVFFKEYLPAQHDGCRVNTLPVSETRFGFSTVASNVATVKVQDIHRDVMLTSTTRHPPSTSPISLPLASADDDVPRLQTEIVGRVYRVRDSSTNSFSLVQSNKTKLERIFNAETRDMMVTTT